MLGTEVVILAQGPRACLGPWRGFKQMLTLPLCDDIPILARTLRQVDRIAADRAAIGQPSSATLVAWQELASELLPYRASSSLYMSLHELSEPGDSALKGIARYLEDREKSGRRYQATIVLLGDVVYSWKCLHNLWSLSRRAGFAGTSNLSSERGDIWGIAWSKAYEDRMLSNLRDALLRCPINLDGDDKHHHNQLGRWITGWSRGDLSSHVAKMRSQGMYADIDDYTHDIDIQHDLVLLPELSLAAQEDDSRHVAQA